MITDTTIPIFHKYGFCGTNYIDGLAGAKIPAFESETIERSGSILNNIGILPSKIMMHVYASEWFS